MPTLLQRLFKTIEKTNIAEDLDNDLIVKVGEDTIELAEEDDSTRSKYVKKVSEVMDHVLQVYEEKTFPWPDASNVKYPLLTVAALQFHARVYPEVIKSGKVVKAAVIGRDDKNEKAQQAERVTNHMNYQLTYEQEEWEEQHDKMLLGLPIEGSQFKKTWFDSSEKRNVSEWVRPVDLIVNNSTKSLRKAPRITHRLWFRPREIKTNVNMGLWLDVDLDLSSEEEDKETIQEFFEQHTYLDLDDDGYKEPYIVTAHVGSRKVVRIVAGFSYDDITIKKDGKLIEIKKLIGAGIKIDEIPNYLTKCKIAKINRFEYFTKYSFIPSPDGSFYDIGFGVLAFPLNSAIDTIINQMIDAGTAANSGGGFVARGVNIRGNKGVVEFSRGEYKYIDLPAGRSIRDVLHEMQHSGPSSASFNLLGLLIQSVKDITSVQDIFTGGQQTNETATTTLARIEQGLKVFNAIFKRVYRSLTAEIRLQYRLNGIYLEPTTYYMVLDDNAQGVVSLSDYRNDGTNVIPVADPTMSTNTERMAKAQIVFETSGRSPLINQEEALRRYFQAADIPNIDALIIPAEQRKSPPDPNMIKMQIEMIKARTQAAKTKEEIAKIKADTVQAYAKAVELISSAESKEVGDQLSKYRLQLEGIVSEIDAKYRYDSMGQIQGNEAAQGQSVSGQGGVPGETIPVGA